MREGGYTTAQQTPTLLDGAGLRGLDVDSPNSSSDYFAYLCIPANETTLHQKRMSIADSFIVYPSQFRKMLRRYHEISFGIFIPHPSLITIRVLQFII
jgi:hypothetical protein